MSGEAAVPCGVCGRSDTRPDPRSTPVALRRCPSCRSRFVHPMPTDEALRRRYAAEHGEGKWTALFEQPEPEVFSGRARQLVQVAGSSGRVLDVGCGDGRFLEAVEGVGWSGVGIELAVPPLHAARDRLTRAHLVCGTLDAVADVPAFDAVAFWDVLEHVPDPGALLAGAVRKLRPGGVVMAAMPNAEGFTARLHGARWKFYDLDAFGHLYHLGPAGLSALFRRAGLEVERVTTDGSTDLRDLPEVLGLGRAPGPVAAVLDRVSGALHRVARRVDRANTLVVIGRA